MSLIITHIFEMYEKRNDVGNTNQRPWGGHRGHMNKNGSKTLNSVHNYYYIFENNV